MLFSGLCPVITGMNLDKFSFSIVEFSEIFPSSCMILSSERGLSVKDGCKGGRIPPLNSFPELFEDD